MTERLAYSVKEVAAMVGISRAKMYQLMNDGSIRSVKLGGRRLVRRQAIEDFLDGLDEAERARALFESNRIVALDESMPEVGRHITDVAMARTAESLGVSEAEARRLVKQPARDQVGRAGP